MGLGICLYPPFHWTARWTFLAILVGLATLVCVDIEEWGSIITRMSGKISGVTPSLWKECTTCDCYRAKRWRHFQGQDILNFTHVVRLVDRARIKMIHKLKIDYGDVYFTKLFEEETTSHLPLYKTLFIDATPESSAWNRLKQQLQIKLLSMRQKVMQQDNRFCEPVVSGTSNGADESRFLFEKFVYASAGHSSAAGHGNFERDSYAAVLSRAVSEVFESIGIEFEARNYGMTAMSSAPELALCIDSVYGLDIDFITWDFGQKESGVFWKLPLFVYRAGILSPNRPTILGLHLKEHFSDLMLLAMQNSKILNILVMDRQKMHDILGNLPDMYGLSDQEIQAFPPLVRNFKCQGLIEQGIPFCGEERFNKSICPKRNFMGIWHPGWKRLALSGNLMAVMLTDVLLEAVRELVLLTEYKDPATLLSELQTVNRVSKREFQAFYEGLLDRSRIDSYVNFTTLHGVTPEMVYTSRSLCHIAKLPGMKTALLC